MTLHRDYGHQVFLECDECPETTESGPFDDVIREAKAAGWEITLSGGNWFHKCPDCKGGSNLARQRKLFG